MSEPLPPPLAPVAPKAISLRQNWQTEQSRLQRWLKKRADERADLLPGEQRDMDHPGLKLRVLNFLLSFYAEHPQADQPAYKHVPKPKEPKGPKGKYKRRIKGLTQDSK